MPGFPEAEYQLTSAVEATLVGIRQLSAAKPTSVDDGVAILRDIRVSAYENLNQLQHRWSLLEARRWLLRRDATLEGADWEWNPEQTGTGTEPDLRASIDGSIKLSAEATTSEKPIGSIDVRMRETLGKLSVMPGVLLYFVMTSAMEKRARTKISKNRWDIEVVHLQLSLQNGTQ